VQPVDTFGPLADEVRVVVFGARGGGLGEGNPSFSHGSVGRRRRRAEGSGRAPTGSPIPTRIYACPACAVAGVQALVCRAAQVYARLFGHRTCGKISRRWTPTDNGDPSP
jgi:hypothetical protein